MTGEVRAHNADALRRAITDPDAEGLVTVDMSAVTSLDRAGIRALRAARRVRPFRIVDPSPHVLQVLRGSGTAGMFGIANAPEPEPLGRFRRHARSRTYAVPTAGVVGPDTPDGVGPHDQVGLPMRTIGLIVSPDSASAAF